MNFFDRVRHTWKTRLSRPAVIWSLTLFTMALIYGAVSGRIARDRRHQAMTAHQTEITNATLSFAANLRALETKGSDADVPPWAGSPMDLTFASTMPPAALSDFAIGQSDILPYLGTLSLWNPDIRLFSKYEFEDPVALALGAFDLSKAMLIFMPLLLIMLCFDVLSTQREGRQLGLMLAQGECIRAFFWQGLIIRAGVVLGLALVLALGAYVFQTGTQTLISRLPAFVLWLLGSGLYAAFWIGLIGFVASQNRAREGQVLILLLAWIGFTLILPASALAVAETMYPTPSRLAYLAQTRAEENEVTLAEADLANQFLLDHPEISLKGGGDIPAYFRTAFFVTASVDEATRPVLNSFAKASAHRDNALNWLRFLSPAITVQQFFNEITGSSGARHRNYMAQARKHKAAYAARVNTFVISGQKLPSDFMQKLPDFEFKEASIWVKAKPFIANLIYLSMIIVALIWVTDRRIKQITGP